MIDNYFSSKDKLILGSGEICDLGPETMRNHVQIPPMLKEASIHDNKLYQPSNKNQNISPFPR